MIRIRGAVKVGHMAAGAIGWQRTGEIIGVARCTSNRGVRPRERELRLRMIKRRARPRRCVVAHGAVLRVIQAHVRRRGGVRVIGLVATVTASRQRTEVIAGVARIACNSGVCACKLERYPRLVVIERSTGPIRRGVARIARSREER